MLLQLKCHLIYVTTILGFNLGCYYVRLQFFYVTTMLGFDLDCYYVRLQFVVLLQCQVAVYVATTTLD